MTTAESLAAWLLVSVFVACLWRARLLALAILPPLALSAVQWLERVDTSSASHPLRWLVPIASLSAALLSIHVDAAKLAFVRSPRLTMMGYAIWAQRDIIKAAIKRRLTASILVFASGCADIPALLAWGLPGEWVLVPLQVAVCLVVIGVLIAPERWFHGR